MTMEFDDMNTLTGAVGEKLVVKQQYNKPEINVMYAQNTILGPTCMGMTDGLGGFNS